MDQMWFNPPPNLDEALKVSNEPHTLVQRLYELVVKTSVVPTFVGDAWNFGINSIFTTETDSLALSKGLILSGQSIDRVKDMYLIVVGIETELSEVTFLPPEMRAEILRVFCSKNNITSEELASILHNWRKT